MGVATGDVGGGSLRDARRAAGGADGEAAAGIDGAAWTDDDGVSIGGELRCYGGSIESGRVTGGISVWVAGEEPEADAGRVAVSQANCAPVYGHRGYEACFPRRLRRLR